jgi:hypothetical protein
MTFSYPSNVSRTLDPAGRSLRTVVGLHDHNLSDADVNLIQDLQDWKRHQLLRRTAPSGCLTAPPFIFYNNTPNSFVIPAFDVLFRGEVVQVRGHNAIGASTNQIAVPAPVGGLQAGQLYAVFLELWYAALDPVSGKNYYTAGGLHYFYPYGCVSALGARLTQYPDDVVDPSFNKVTTVRAQLQWRLQIQPVPPGYNFSQHRFGLDPDPGVVAQVFGQGTGAALTSQGLVPLAPITGEATLWRAGGDSLNSLGTMDGYVYAMPLALLFQRTTSIYDPDTAPFGCAGPQGGGLFTSSLSGRYDARFADIIYPDDVVDTRLATSLTGYDLDRLMEQGVKDIFTGACRSALTRSDHPAGATGSLLTELVGLAPSATAALWQNIQAAGSFDAVQVNGVSAGGVRNGLSTDQRTYFTTLQVAPPSGGWAPVVVALPVAPLGSSNTIPPVPPGTVITSVFVQYPNASGQIAPMMGTQLTVSGVGTSSVTVAPVTYPPGGSPLLITLGVTFPAATGVDLQKVPTGPVFGQLSDPDGGSGGVTLPLFGASDYDPGVAIPAMTQIPKQVWAYAPNFSSSLFGVRVHQLVANSSATAGTVANTLVFTLPRLNLDGRFTGLYITQALSPAGTPIPIISRELSGPNLVVTLQGPLDPDASTELVAFCHQTAQAAINPAVRGSVSLEEIIHISVVTSTTVDLASAQDRRITLLPPVYTTEDGLVKTVVTGYVQGGRLRGISGDDSGSQTCLVWVMQGSSDQFVPALCTLAISVAGFTLTVLNTNLVGVAWFAAASFYPALIPSATAIFSLSYVPYQGEGVTGRSYQVLATAENGLVTTNGTGTAPIPGVRDVFPYDRELPVATTLPTLGGWSDTDLTNEPLSSGLDGNYDTKRGQNVETTFSTPLRTNDFVPPLQGSLKQLVQLGGGTGQGFGQIQPHVGFAIDTPLAKTDLGLSTVTVAPITIYVDNVNGSASNDGMSPESPLPTVNSALALLPPILLHPVSILLQGNVSKPYRLSDLVQTDFAYSSLEGGIYCLGDIGFTMQGAGCLTIGCTQPPGLGVTPVVISGQGISGNDASWAGSTPFCAFAIAAGHVVFNGITFNAPGSLLPFWTEFGAVRADGAEVEFRNCSLLHPQLGVTAVSGSRITLTDTTATLGPTEVGVLGSESNIDVINPTLVVINQDGSTATDMSMVFFAVTSGGSLTLAADAAAAPVNPDPTQETGFPGRPGPFPTVAQAELGSTIIAGGDFYTLGQAVLNGQSVLQVSTVSRSVASALTQDLLISWQAQFITIAPDSTSSVVGWFS